MKQKLDAKCSKKGKAFSVIINYADAHREFVEGFQKDGYPTVKRGRRHRTIAMDRFGTPAFFREEMKDYVSSMNRLDERYWNWVIKI